MPTEIDNEWKNNFSNSQALYDYFSKPVLTDSILKSLAAEGNKSISRPEVEDAIDSILQPIAFGDIIHVPHIPVDGSTTSTYPEASARTPLKAFRLATNSDVRKPRVVITAGMHARELAPPLAVARYFSAMIVSYVTSQFLMAPGCLPIVHRAFKYKGSQHQVFDENNNDISKETQNSNDDKHIKNKNYADPAFSQEIDIDQYAFTGIAALVDRLEIIVFPTCNPAGLDFVMTKAQEDVKDAIIRANWRKNRASLKSDQVPKAYGGTVASDRRKYEQEEQKKEMFAIGVDLNRNADICWYYPLYYSASYLKEKLHSCSRNPYSYIEYIGANPNSELETRAVLSALMSDLDHMATAFPALLKPTTVQGQVVVVENKTGLPVATDATPNPDTTSDDIAYLVAGRPDFQYKDYLFYLDVHAYSRAIMVPWSMDTLREVDSSTPMRHTYLNPAFDRKRDGISKLSIPDRAKMIITGLNKIMTPILAIKEDVLIKTNDQYQEAFPKILTFSDNKAGNSTIPVQHEILVEQIERFANSMRTSISSAGTQGVEPDYKTRVERRSDYKIMQAPGMYTVTGSPMDYAFSLNIRDIVGFGTNQPLPPTTEPMNLKRTGPVIALTIEVGHEDEQGFFPLDKHPESNPSQKPYMDFDDDIKGVYSKVERETFAAIHVFLQQSLKYFDEQFEVKK